MKANTFDLIGKTIFYKCCGNTIVVKIEGFVKAATLFDSDSYIGTKTISFDSGKSFTDNWASFDKDVESRIKEGIYKVID